MNQDSGDADEGQAGGPSNAASRTPIGETTGDADGAGDASEGVATDAGDRLAAKTEDGLATDAAAEPATPASAGPLRCYHLDGDGARQAVATFAADLDREVELAGGDDATAAVEAIRERPIDALVVEPGTVEDWAWFYEACRGVTDAPLVVYTLQEPDELDANVVAAADTIVRKGQAAHRAFLFEKLASIVRGRDGHEPADVVGDAGTVCVFALDERGRICDRHGDPAALFGTAWRAAGEGSVRLHERLAAGLANGADYRRRVDEALAATGDAAAIEGLRCEVDAPEGTRTIGYQSVPVETGGDVERVEVYRDVTNLERRLTETERAARLVEEVTDGLYMMNADGEFTYVNEAYADLVGYDREELLGNHGAMLMREGDLKDGQRVTQEVIAGEREDATNDVELVRKDGTTVDASVNFTTLTGRDGAYEGIVGVARDVTDRLRRERQLLQYRTLVEAAGDPMYVMDTDGTIELHNTAMAAWDGDPEADLVGKHATEVTSEEGYCKGSAAVKQLLADDDRSWARYEIEETDADGENHVFEVTVGLITDEEGAFVGSVGTFRDVTRRRLREEELDLLKQILTRVLRHNIRNRANVIEGHAELLCNRLEGRDSELARTIVEKCQDLVETSEKVRTVERVIDGEGLTVEHDLGRVLEDSVDAALATHPGADIRADVPTGLRVEAVPKLRVAFQNLLENALEHGRGPDDADGSWADAAGTGDDLATVWLEAENGGDEVRIVVEDDGPGIPDSEIEVLERSRETALEHSSGMGLWLVNWVVEKSGGELDFERDDGTRAVVRLPTP